MTFQDWLRRVEKTQRATVAGSGGKKYPYKDILLAAVLIRIASGKQATPEVMLDPALRGLYFNVLERLFPNGPCGEPDQPFRHLEKTRRCAAVWTLEAEDLTQDRLRSLVATGADFRAIMPHVRCARLEQTVFERLATSCEARLQLGRMLAHNLSAAGAVDSELGELLEAMVLQGETDWTPQTAPLDSASPGEPLLEAAIEAFIVENWEQTPFYGRGVQLHGQQYTIPTGVVDLLGWQRQQEAWWVIELKKGRADDRVIGQLLRYTGWLREHKCRAKEDVRGVILARDASDNLRYAASGAPDVEIWTFDDDLKIHPAA